MATKKKGMGIKTSVKSGNFRPTKQGAGMTKKGVAAYRKFIGMQLILINLLLMRDYILLFHSKMTS
jgi:hypothetical protein